MRLVLGLLAICLIGAAPIAPAQASALATTSIEAASGVDAPAAPSGPAYTLPVAAAPRRVLLCESVLHLGAIASPQGHLAPEHVALPSARWRRGPPRSAPDTPEDPTGSLGRA